MITVFTPTYNRADLLSRLYHSLCQQSNQTFEWLVVDDGSKDQTPQVMETFIAENKIKIHYHQKNNGGKHTAINQGLALAQYPLFFIVDSDDYLTPDAIQSIIDKSPEVLSNPKLAGLSFRRGYTPKQYIGSQFDFSSITDNALNFRFKHKIEGDMAELFKTDILKQYPFPEGNNERFCPEALVWNRIALTYDLLWISKIIYIGEYLEGGLTDQIFKIRKNSPTNTLQYYAELANMPIPFKQKIKACINYWRFAKYTKISFAKHCQQLPGWYSILAMPLGYAFALKDQKS
jgi:glycosyltransferase involved in cell wall biosynthesis